MNDDNFDKAVNLSQKGEIYPTPEQLNDDFKTLFDVLSTDISELNGALVHARKKVLCATTEADKKAHQDVLFHYKKVFWHYQQAISKVFFLDVDVIKQGIHHEH